MVLDNIVVSSVFDIMTIPIECGTHRQICNRFSYGFSFASDAGVLRYDHHGESYTSDATHAVLLPMGQTYTLTGIHAGDFPLINFYCDSSFTEDRFSVFTISNLNYYLKTFDYIKRLCLYSQPSCQARAMGAFYEMISQVMEDQHNSENKLLSPAVEYMEKNFADPNLSIEEIASKAHISQSYFRRLFKEQYGVSPKSFILNARINKAKEMLHGHSYLSIAFIAEKCGFTNVYHFDRYFKAQVGCSPTEYNHRFGQML